MRRRRHHDRAARPALRDPLLQMLRFHAERTVERAPSRNRPEHAKQQPVDMMMRDAAEHGCLRIGFGVPLLPEVYSVSGAFGSINNEDPTYSGCVISAGISASVRTAS